MDFTVISFYTNDWLYPKYAGHLRDDCDRLGLKHYIVERPSTNHYVGNCQLKPFFVQECLEEFKSPVLWMDADGSILQRPDRLFDADNVDYDLIANRSVNDHSRIHVGSMMLNYTEPMRDFINAWCNEIIRKSPLDDAAFNLIWEKFKNNLKVKLLPESYFYIHLYHNDPVPDHAVIMHRLSRSDLKKRYKAAVE